MGLKVTNNAFGTLNAGITNSDTTVVLQSGQGSRFPSLSSGDYFYATLIDTSNNLEIVKVTARSTDTMTIVRAQDNTTARAYSTNDRFELRPTAAMLNEVIAAGEAATAALTSKVSKTGDTMTGDLTFAAGDGILLENPATGRFGSLRTTSQGTELSSHNGFGEPLILKAPSSTGYVSIETNGLERLKVNNNGQVVMPNQPAFMARRTTSFTINNSTSTVTFQEDGIRNSGSYSTSTGRFTAPVGGTYFFHASVQPSTTGGLTRIEIRRNGTSYQYVSSGWTNLPSRGDINISEIVALNAGDYVDVLVTTSFNCTFDNHGHFCGYLIG